MTDRMEDRVTPKGMKFGTHKPISFLQARTNSRNKRQAKGGGAGVSGLKPAPVSPKLVNREEEDQEDTKLSELVRDMPDHELEPTHWQNWFDSRREVNVDSVSLSVYLLGDDSAPVTILFLHGAGQSALSFACASNELKDQMKIIAYDARAHGESEGDESDLTMDQMTEDAMRVIGMYVSSKSKLIIAGHSLGGAVAAHVAKRCESEGKVQLSALVIIDVVEGTALDFLPHMNAWLMKRPRQFPSQEAAIRYIVETGQIRQLQSAKASTAPQLRKQEDGSFVWRTRLDISEPYWYKWFSGLSKMFLSVSVPKLLILADDESLDRELTIAQMQGKYQAVVIPNCGHYIHEDDPARFAASLLHFLRRNRLLTSADEVVDAQPNIPPVFPMA